MIKKSTRKLGTTVQAKTPNPKMKILLELLVGEKGSYRIMEVSRHYSMICYMKTITTEDVDRIIKVPPD